MLRDITLGQYYPVDSLLHRLDPRTKLFGTLVYIVTLFIADNLWAYLAATIFLITAIKLSNVPVKFMVRGLKSIMFLLLLSVSFNLFLTPGTPIFKIGFLHLGRPPVCGIYGDPSCLSRYGIHDPYTHNDAEPADRRSGKEPGLLKEGRRSGPRGVHDDVHRAPVYPDLN